jgi:hypothetical protein
VETAACAEPCQLCSRAPARNDLQISYTCTLTNVYAFKAAAFVAETMPPGQGSHSCVDSTINMGRPVRQRMLSGQHFKAWKRHRLINAHNTLRGDSSYISSRSAQVCRKGRSA